VAEQKSFNDCRKVRRYARFSELTCKFQFQMVSNVKKESKPF